MSLSPSEEALVRDLIAQNAALLSLASSESTIISKLGATKTTLSALTAASSLSDSDLMLVRQGVTDKSVTGAVLKAYATPPQAAFPLRNRIINGNFRVNQRAYVSGAATSGPNQYTLDRWRVVTSGQNLAFSVSGNGYQVTAPAGGIEQVIEGTNIEGGSYVLSWSGTATATINGSAATNGGAVTLTAGSNVTVKFSSGTVSLVQLEPGTAATAFEHRPIDVELAACQRYYESGSFSMDVYCSSGSSSQARVGFAVAKRVAPTISQVATASGPQAGLTLYSGDIQTGGFSSGRSGWISTAQASYTNTWTASAEL